MKYQDLKEYSLSINSFNNPDELKRADAACLLIMRLILLTPGTIQTHPEMGVGLITKYRFMYDTELQNLKKLITDQINLYLPELNLTSVELTLNPKDLKELIIQIQIENTLYVLQTEGETLKLANL